MSSIIAKKEHSTKGALFESMLPLLLSQLLVHLHQRGYAGAFGHIPDGEAVCLHHSPVILLVGGAQFRRHGQLIIEIGQAGIRIEGAGIQYRLGGLLDLGPLRVSRCGSGEVVVDNGT